MLSVEETKLLDKLHGKWLRQRPKDDENLRVYQGMQRIAQLGISIPPEMEPFAFPMSWCRTWVETLESRMDVRLILRAGDTSEDDELRADWEANDLPLESVLAHRDLLIFGRCVASVSWPAREHRQTRPVIRVESPRDIAVDVDPVTRAMTGALRVYQGDDGLAQHMTLYLPDETVHLRQELSRWVVDRRDHHGLGRVPIVVGFARRMSGSFESESMMEDIKPWVAMAARVVLNLQVAMEAVSTPQKIAYGMSQTDFVDPETGEPLDEWETYLGAIWAITKSKKDGASIEQLPAGDLKGFLDVMVAITRQVAAATGLPLRMLGHSEVNPASEGGIKADESRLVKTVERINTIAGAFWGWALGIGERIRVGEWPEGSPIVIEWRNPGTPTISELADSVSKRSGGAPTLSARGAMHEMGYTQARIDQELRWLDQESAGMYTDVDAKLERTFGGSPWA